MSLFPSTDRKTIAIKWINQAAGLALICGLLGLVLMFTKIRVESMWITLLRICSSLLTLAIAWGLYYRWSRVAAVIQLILTVPVLGAVVGGGIMAGANIAILAAFAFVLLVWIRAVIGAFRYHALTQNEGGKEGSV